MTDHTGRIQDGHEDHVFIRGLELVCSIGIYDHEKQTPQRVWINIDMTIRPSPVQVDDQIENVVSYETVANQVRDLVARGHINLVETMAEDIASLCLQNDRVLKVQVRVEKPDILSDATSVGIEITRLNKGG